jgi:hypothetical protein
VDVKDGISVVRWSLNHNRCRTRRHDESVRIKKLMEKESRITRLKMKNEEEAAEKRLQKRLGS